MSRSDKIGHTFGLQQQEITEQGKYYLTLILKGHQEPLRKWGRITTRGIIFQILGLKSNHAQQNCEKLGRGGDVSTLTAHGELLRCWLDVGSGCAPSEVSPLTTASKG